MNKSSELLNLSNWFGIDHILFGNNDPKKVLGEEKYKSYVSKKGALLSNLFEIYTKLKFSPKLGSFKDSVAMKNYSIKQAGLCENKAKTIVVENDTKKCINEEINEFATREKVSPDVIAKYIVRKKLAEVALDIYLMETAIKEGCKKCLDNFDGKILVKAHKSLRESLIDYIN